MPSPPLSSAGTSGMMRSDMSSLSRHPSEPIGLESLSQVPRPDFADSPSVLRQHLDQSELA